MSSHKTEVEHFFGSDPIKGEDARLSLLKSESSGAVSMLLRSGKATSPNAQVEQRLQAITAAIGSIAAPALTDVIRSADWGAMSAATACFGGLKGATDLALPLVEIIKQTTEMDRQRMAIEALGYLRADGWSFHLRRLSRTGDWETDSPTSRVDKYSFDKLAPFVLPALVRFAGHARDRHNRESLHRELRDYLSLFEAQLTNRMPTGYELIRRTAYELDAGSVDPLVEQWAVNQDEEWRTLTCDLLASIRSIRSAGFLLDVATNDAMPPATRTAASIALGELRDLRVAARLATHIRDAGANLGYLGWAFSALRMVPTDWTGTDALAEQVLAGAHGEEPAAQLGYSLALAGDRRVEKRLIDELDSQSIYLRWTAALGLARLLGPASRDHLSARAEEAHDDLERSALLAASVHSGDAAQTSALHESLSRTTQLPQLRSIWRTAILSAFKGAGAFDPRAYGLWCSAARLSVRLQFEFEVGAGPSPPATAIAAISRSAGTAQENAVPTRQREHLVFLSYAHADNEDDAGRWLNRLLEHFVPIIRQEALDVWSDQDLSSGTAWHATISERLERARAAVLLVSPAFLASNYIASSELPVLLRKAKQDGLKILPIILSPCVYQEATFKYPDPKHGPEEFTLSSIQFVNPPSKTMEEMSRPEQNRIFVKVAKELLAIMKQP